MSHFSVLVFGEDVEKILAPYDESIIVPEYQDGEVSKESLDYFIKLYSGSDPNASMDELYAKNGAEYNNNRWKKVNNVWYEYSTYNPKSKWDWYSIGGRFNNFYTLKAGVPCDDSPIRKRDIDIKSMQKVAKKVASKDYDYVWKYLSDVSKEDRDSYVSWDKMNENIDEKDRYSTALKEKYRNQPLVKKFLDMCKQNDYLIMLDELDHFLIPRDKYIKNAVDRVLVPFAYANADGWFERGKMGWFACVSDEVEIDAWTNQFMTYFNSLPDDTVISVVDCHI